MAGEGWSMRFDPAEQSHVSAVVAGAFPDSWVAGPAVGGDG
jgi:hypothetical protein